jgi:hypothetical protein
MIILESVGVPEWVPPMVAEMASLLVGDLGPDDEIPDIIERLLSHPRMKRVWHELSKKIRQDYKPTPKPFHAAVLPPQVGSWKAMAQALRTRGSEYSEMGRDPIANSYKMLATAAQARHGNEPEALEESARQELAMAMVFALTVSLYNVGIKTVSRSDVERKIHELDEQSKAVEANAIRRQSEAPANTRFIVHRQRTDPRINAFVEGLAFELKNIYGEALYGVIATLTSIAFQLKSPLRDPNVRAMLRTRGPKT